MESDVDEPASVADRLFEVGGWIQQELCSCPEPEFDCGDQFIRDWQNEEFRDCIEELSAREASVDDLHLCLLSNREILLNCFEEALCVTAQVDECWRQASDVLPVCSIPEEVEPLLATCYSLP